MPGPLRQRGPRWLSIRTLLIATLATLAAPASAGAVAYAPLSEPGPALSVPLAQLQASLQCEPSVRRAQVEPVLLNPATGFTAAENFSWNWEPALAQLGIPWCAYTAPYSTLGDIQVSGEYLVYAIRTMYGLAGRKIAILGHSQGGMSMRWALRFWPDTRAMVDKVIAFSASNHGTTVESPGLCSAGCPPADWQQIAASQFVQALNSFAETFPAISYTEVYTHTDEVVQPANDNEDASAALHTGGGTITNVATQDICPLDLDEHLMNGTVDPVAYALGADALSHPGPADPARIPSAVCTELFMPGVNQLNVNSELQILEAAPGLASVAAGPLATATTGAPVVFAEPPLACYVLAGCAASGVGTMISASGPTIKTTSGETARALGGRALRLGVHLLTTRGYPIAGEVAITDGSSLTSVTTGTTGRGALTAAAGPDRTIALSYAGTNIYPGALLSLRITNHAHGTVRLTTRRLPARGRATFAGAVTGANGRPASLRVSLQVREGRRRWRTVATVRSRANGRWTVRVAWRRGRFYRVVVGGTASAPIRVPLPAG